MINVPQDSYVTVAEADEYNAIRPSAQTWAALSEPEKEQRLVAASDYLDSQYIFNGKKTDENQPREFPRNGATEIPTAIKKAVFELALQDSLTSNSSAEVKREKVDVLEVEYFQSDDGAIRFGYIDGLLRPFLLQSKRMGAILVGNVFNGCCQAI